MKKITSLLLITVALVSCNSVKKTQSALNSGDYDGAIYNAVDKLRDNKTKKANQPFILILEEAYAKASERDLQQVAFLKKDGSPANLENIYELYNVLHKRQELIKPLLPLYVEENGRQAKFKFQDYSDDIITYKNKLSEYLYVNASEILKNGFRKEDFRRAWDDFDYLNKINPGYRDVSQKMDEAHFKGTDFVKVALFNDTGMVIPQRLEDELLNFNTYGINDFWTEYHSNPQPKIDYSFEMELAFTNINITPEQVKEREVIREKQIKDGWKYLLDNNGNRVKDSLGNYIKVDKFVTVRCQLYEFTQFKAVSVSGTVVYKNLKNQQVLNSYPLNSEFIFQHQYATYKGDRRAIDDPFLNLINQRALPFPSNEQMVYDAGEDLKRRLKDIISRHRFN